MVFSSVEFLFYFLPLFLIAYFGLPQKNFVLLIFSLFFYSWGEGLFVLLLIASAFWNHAVARQIEESSGRRAMLVMAVGVTANLFALFFFKYLDFVILTLNAILESPFTTLGLHLPIGISFFTFHAISYLVDVFRRQLPAERNPINVLLYLSMFPQLIAGPIIRFGTVQKEVHKREVTIDKIGIGLKFFIIGLGQKVLIANTVATPVDAIHALPTASLNASLAWLSAACYTLQIYFDFGGYSNMAIGLGLMLGFYFPLNFNYPYISQSITEFWRRWHITLSTWFRDYLYIPLGGNRSGSVRTYVNLVLVFALCGLWHGASWNFLIWGLYYGVFLILERLGLGTWLLHFGRACRHFYVLLIVVVGWVFFRSNDLTEALAHLRALAGVGSGDGITYPVGQYLLPDVVLAMIAGCISATPYPSMLARRVVAELAWLRWPSLVASGVGFVFALVLYSVFLLSTISIAAGKYNPFIYFRF
jgi:alginate O-acetyltransferase complex protein AlgI